jgi:archaemetzincin
MIPGGTPQRLHIVGFGHLDEGLLRWLAQELPRILPCECRLLDPQPLQASWRHESTGQLDVDAALSGLIDRYAPAAGSEKPVWMLAITAAELLAEGTEHVFGEATVGGCCALVSIARLQPSPKPKGEDLAVLRLRLLKESLHEIGHLAGLAHCTNPDCVMAVAATVAAVDRKGSDFCSRCLRAPTPRPQRT